MWRYYRKTLIKPDGSSGGAFVTHVPKDAKETYACTISGRRCIATIYGYKSEWRVFKNLPVPRKTKRNINISFSYPDNDRGGYLFADASWEEKETLQAAFSRALLQRFQSESLTHQDHQTK